MNPSTVKHPNGKMHKEALKEMMSKALAGISVEEVSNIETYMFRIYDENQNGFIDFHEFMTVFSIFTGEESVSVLERIFRIFDVDNSGTISKEEMLVLVKQRVSRIRHDFVLSCFVALFDIVLVVVILSKDFKSRIDFVIFVYRLNK